MSEDKKSIPRPKITGDRPVSINITPELVTKMLAYKANDPRVDATQRRILADKYHTYTPDEFSAGAMAARERAVKANAELAKLNPAQAAARFTAKSEEAQAAENPARLVNPPDNLPAFLTKWTQRFVPDRNDTDALDAATPPGTALKYRELAEEPKWVNNRGDLLESRRSRVHNDLKWKAHSYGTLAALLGIGGALGLGYGAYRGIRKALTAKNMLAAADSAYTEDLEQKEKKKKAPTLGEADQSKSAALIKQAGDENKTTEAKPLVTAVPDPGQPGAADTVLNTIFSRTPARHDWDANKWWLPAVVAGVPAAFMLGAKTTTGLGDAYRDHLINKRKQKALEEYRRLLYESTKSSSFNAAVDMMADGYTGMQKSGAKGEVLGAINTGSGFGGPLTGAYLTYALLSALAGYGLMRRSVVASDPGRAKLHALETAIKLRKLSKPVVIQQELPNNNENSATEAEPLSSSAVSPSPYLASFPNEAEGVALEKQHLKDIEPSLVDKGLDSIRTGLGRAQDVSEEAVNLGMQKSKEGLQASRKKLRALMGKHAALDEYFAKDAGLRESYDNLRKAYSLSQDKELLNSAERIAPVVKEFGAYVDPQTNQLDTTRLMREKFIPQMMANDKTPFLMRLLMALFFGPKGGGWGKALFGEDPHANLRTELNNNKTTPGATPLASANPAPAQVKVPGFPNGAPQGTPLLPGSNRELAITDPNSNKYNAQSAAFQQNKNNINAARRQALANTNKRTPYIVPEAAKQLAGAQQQAAANAGAWGTKTSPVPQMHTPPADQIIPPVKPSVPGAPMLV